MIMSYIPHHHLLSLSPSPRLYVDAHVPTGTIVVTKSVGSWAQNIITSLYHNRVFSAPNISPLLGPAGNGMMRVLSADSDPSASADGIAAGGMPSRRRRRMALNSLFSQPGVINMDTMSLAEARTATNTINVPLDVDEHAAEYAAAGQPLNRMEGHFSTVMNNLDDSVTSPDTVVFSSSPLLPPIIDNSSPELRRSIDTSRPHSGNAARVCILSIDLFSIVYCTAIVIFADMFSSSSTHHLCHSYIYIPYWLTFFYVHSFLTHPPSPPDFTGRNAQSRYPS